MRCAILFGYPSSGKTYFGRLLAQEWNTLFTDTDRLVEQLYEEIFQVKRCCREIYFKSGEEIFRQLETRVICSLISHGVIAVGGGTLLNPQNCAALQKLGPLIYLEVGKMVLKQRIMQRGVPAFLNSHDPEEAFEKMYEMRQPIYENSATFKVSIEGKSDQEVVEELKKCFLSKIGF